MRFLKLALVVCVLSASCVTVGKRMKYGDYERIVVYRQAPNRPYRVIGSVAGSDEYMNDLLRDLQCKAIRLGGHALLVEFEKVTEHGDDDQMVNIRANVLRFH